MQHIIETVATIKSAIRALSGVCDGATTRDGAGFNGTDSNFGKSLAQQDRWSPKQVVCAQKIIRKYAGQLSGYGIDITGLPTLTLEELMNAQPAAPVSCAPDKTPAIPSQVLLSDDGKFVEFYFPYNFDEKEYVKNVLRARFVSGNAKYWRIPVRDLYVGDLQKYGDSFGAEIDPPVITALTEGTVKEAETIALSKAQDADISDIDLSGFRVDLFPFQRAGVRYALAKKKVLIGDDMGLGKTFQSLAVIAAAKLERFVVVCPASVKINWERSVRTALPESVSTSIWSGKAGRTDVNGIIINYDNLKKHAAVLKDFRPDAIIFDEIHYLKSANAQRTEVAHELAKGVEYVIGLTGTPIMNRPNELVSPLKMFGVLEDFGGWSGFVKRYCQAFQRMIWVKTKTGRSFQKMIWDTSGAANLVELNERLRAVCMVRRRKVDGLTELPTKQRAQLVFEIDNREEYTAAQDNLIEYVKACAAEDEAFLKTVAHLSPEEKKQAVREYQAEAGKRAEQAEQLVFMERAKQIATRGKLKAAKEWIADFLETGEKLLVFAVHQEAQEALLTEFPGAARIVAADNSEQRQVNIDRFRKDEGCRLMVASLGAGGTGVDGLQEVCSNVAFLEMGWTPAVHLQAEDRCHRIGQDGQVTAYYMVAEDTIEEDIQAMLAQKQAVCDSALDGAPEKAEGTVFNELLDALMLKQTGAKKKRAKRTPKAQQSLV